MRTRSVLRLVASFGVALVSASALLPAVADGAVVICERKRKLRLRRDACARKETLVDVAELGNTGPKGDKGDKGDQGDPGPGARWALVSESFGILAQSGGIAIASSAGSAIIVLDFGTALTGKTIIAAPAITPGDPTNRGPVEAGLCGPGPQGIAPFCGLVFGPSFENDRYVVVVTTSSTGGTEQHAFYVAVF